MAITPAVPRLPGNTAYSWPVPRELVHKAAHTEVLLTGYRQCGEREFEVDAEWPRDHGFWRTGADGVQDPLLLVETTRQVLPLLAHMGFDVPVGHQLIWDHYHCAFSVPFLSVSGAPAQVTLRLSTSRPPQRGGRLRQIALTMTVVCDGRTLGTTSTVYSAHSPAVYRRLRGPGTPLPPEAMAAALAPPAPLDPSLVGRESGREVVLGASTADGDGGETDGADGAASGREGTASGPGARPEEEAEQGGRRPERRRLRVDTASPWLFDHPVDHVPGMLLLEAARQASHLAAGSRTPRITRIDAQFHRYVDLDAPSWVGISPGPGPRPGADAVRGERTVTVDVVQHGEKAFTADVGYVTQDAAESAVESARPRTPGSEGDRERAGASAPAGTPSELG